MQLLIARPVPTQFPRAIHLGHVHEPVVSRDTVAIRATSFVLVGKTRLHHFLQASAFLLQFIDCLIFCHKSALQILYHSLLDLLKVPNALLIHFFLSLLP